MVFFDILSAEQTLFCPEVPICGMLISLHQKQRWGNDSLRMNKSASSGYRLLFSTRNAVLRYTF
jgi:hypothetical protein